jgi:hypothetical protein
MLSEADNHLEFPVVWIQHREQQMAAVDILNLTE